MTTLLSHSLLLRNNLALAQFCETLRQTRATSKGKTPNQHASPVIQAAIVCERKEDVLAVRSHVFNELKDQTGGENALSGLGTYTVDSLARSLVQWSMLALRAAARKKHTLRLGELSQTQLSKPYLDIVTQEKLVRHILLTLGYKNPDALPLAKQILTLVDTPLPADLSLAELFLRPHDPTAKRGGFTTTQGTRSLAYILSALQATRAVLAADECMRLQTFVTQGIQLAQPGTLEALVEVLPPEIPALHADLLWFEGPSYALLSDDQAWEKFKACCTPEEVTSHSIVFEYQPGNFGSAFTKSLGLTVRALRQIVSQRKLPSTHGCTGQLPQEIVSRTYVSAPQFQTLVSTSEQAAAAKKTPFQLYNFEKIFVFQDLNHFLVSAAERLDQLAPEDFALLGDVSTEHTRMHNSIAAGRYSVCDDDTAVYFSWKQSLGNTVAEDLQKLPLPVLEVLQRIESESALYDEMLQKHSALLANCLTSYGLQVGSTNAAERVRILALDAEYQAAAGPSHPALSGLPQALSFFPSNCMPKRWVVFGRPHSAKQASVNVRALNDVLFELIKSGVSLSIPASDFMYNIFWKSLFAGSLPVVLLLQSEQDLEDLVEGLHLKLEPNIVKKEAAPDAWGGQMANEALCRFLTEGLYPATDPNWLRKVKETTVAVTAFEEYVTCPLRFYLKHVLKLGAESRDPLAYDPLAAGTHTHKTLELLITAINFSFQSTAVQTDATKEPLPLACSKATPARAEFARFIASFLSKWVTTLLQPAIFAAQNEQVWLQATRETLAALRLAPHEAHCSALETTLPQVLHALFEQPQIPLQPFQANLGREARKRFFIRFLHAEAARIEADLKSHRLRTTTFVEHPVGLALGKELKLHGTIDRIDSVFDLASETLLYQEIIDYKTAKPLAADVQLSLVPEQLLQDSLSNKNKQKMQVSVQGALYILAFAEEQARKGIFATPLSFSLLRLGNLDWQRDPYASVHIGATGALDNAALPYSQAEFQSELEGIRSHYNHCAERLHEGQFAATPKDPEQCSSCAYQLYCPVGRAAGSQEGGS